MIKSNLYKAHFNEISSLANKLSDTLDELPSCDESMEECEIREALYKAAEALSDAKDAIEYFSKTAEEGTLKLTSSGKFVMAFKNGEESYPLSCGRRIEVYLDEDPSKHIDSGWYVGRVEHNGQYYFYGSGKPNLYKGMKVRIRK